MNSAYERNTVMLFSKTRNATFAEMFEKLILISHSVGGKKVLEMGNVYLFEIYIDEPDIRNFCERCMKSYVNSDEQ